MLTLLTFKKNIAKTIYILILTKKNIFLKNKNNQIYQRLQ